jgi:hypothetical protein
LTTILGGDLDFKVGDLVSDTSKDYLTINEILEIGLFDFTFKTIKDEKQPKTVGKIRKLPIQQLKHARKLTKLEKALK